MKTVGLLVGINSVAWRIGLGTPRALAGEMIVALGLLTTSAVSGQPTMPAVTPPTAATPAATAPGTRPHLVFGQVVPELAVTELTTGKAISLADLPAQPIILQFGSITEPTCRQHMAEAEKLATAYAGKARFYLIYQREAHAADGPDPLEINTREAFGFAAPVSTTERVTMARQLKERLHITTQTILVDEFNDTTAQRYKSPANLTLLLDSQHQLVAAYPTFDAPKLSGALDEVLAGKPVSAANQGPTRTAIPSTAKAETNGPAPATLEARLYLAIDALTLTEPQKAAIRPALTDYLAALQTLPQRNATASQPASGTAPATTDPFTKARSSADHLQSVLHEKLSAGDYENMMDLLTQGPGRRLFSTERK